jgi:hypothetical protein
LPTKPAPQIHAVSYSRYSTYTECPLKCKLQNIDKIQDTAPAPAMDRGTGIHAMGQAFVSATIPKADKRDGDRLKPFAADIAKAAKGVMPTALHNFKSEFTKLRKLKAITEQEWAFDVNWRPTSWFAMHGPTAAFLRVKVDVHYEEKKGGILPIIDLKTGKVYPEKGKEQLELYGIAGLLMYPAVKLVQAKLWYLDHGVQADHNFPRESLDALKKLWLGRFAPMLNDRKFPARPGDACRWCFYRASNTKNNGTGRQLCKHG